MLIGSSAILLNLLSITVLAFIVSALFVVIAERLIIPRIDNVSFTLRKTTLWLTVTAPWWIAVSCLVIFWPQQQGIFPFNWLNDFAHWHHVEQFNFASWHTFTLVVAGAYLTWSLAKSVHASTRQFSALSDLLGLTTEPEIKNSENVSYYMIANTIPTAFTSGLLRPKVYLTTALTQQVTARELAIIVSHETAHVKARDPLFKFIFAIFANVFPSSTAINLRNQYTLLTEQMADHAVTNVHDRFDVAQALINIVRLQSRNSHIASTTASYFGEDQISKRVNYLITPDSTRSHWAITMTLLLLSMLPWVTASSVDGLHHLIETIFTH